MDACACGYDPESESSLRTWSRLPRAWGCVAVLTILASCASNGTVSQDTLGKVQRPTGDHARVYLYRPFQQCVANPSIEVYLDEKSVASLEPETATSVEVIPGRHRVTGRVSALFGDYWLPPAEFSTQPGKVYFVYPIARISKEQVPFWRPFAVALGTLILSGGNYAVLTPGGAADVVVGRYCQLADEDTPDAYVDRMKRARLVPARGQ